MSDLSVGFYAERMGYGKRCACGHSRDPNFFHDEDRCVAWECVDPMQRPTRISWDDWYTEHTMRLTLVVEAAEKGQGLAQALRQLAEWTEKVRERF